MHDGLKSCGCGWAGLLDTYITVGWAGWLTTSSFSAIPNNKRTRVKGMLELAGSNSRSSFEWNDVDAFYMAKGFASFRNQGKCNVQDV